MPRLIDADALIQAIDPMYVAKKDIVADTFAEGCMQFEKLIKQQPTISQWIPASEKLPKEENVVLIWHNEVVSIDFVRNGKWVMYDDVIAWMPLPEPYKVGESE